MCDFERGIEGDLDDGRFGPTAESERPEDGR